MLLSNLIAEPRALEAVHLALASPYPCSLLISGASGTGKSSILTAIRRLPSKRNIVVLPSTLSIEELGEKSNIEETLRQGRLVCSQSLAERIHGAVVLIDNTQIMSPDVLARLLDIQANSLPQNPICLIATVNTQDGSLRSSILDRFDMYVELSNHTDPLVRMQIIRQAMKIEKDTLQVDTDTVLKLNSYTERCKLIKPTDNDFHLVAETCRKAFVLGHRADIALLRVASVYAAVQERNSLISEDFSAVKDLVLAHRITNAVPPEEDPQDKGEESQTPHSKDNDSSATNESDKSDTPSESQGIHMPLGEMEREDNAPTPEKQAPQQGIIPPLHEDVSSLRLEVDPINLLGHSNEVSSGLGSRLKSLVAKARGRYYKATSQRTDDSYRVALLPTIREALPYQYYRRQHYTSDLSIIINSADIRYQLCHRRTGYHILFAVDASGSMGAQKRMHRVKGFILELLRSAYEERDHVGLLTFRGDEAELKLPLTKSFARAYELLQDLKTGGRTPLFLGLSRSLEIFKHVCRKDKRATPVIVLITDGRATSRYAGENSAEALKELAMQYKQIGAKILVIDSEEGFIRLGKAKALSEVLQADAYYPMEELILPEDQTKPVSYKKKSINQHHGNCI